MTPIIPHIPVLSQEVLEAFDTIDNGIIIDCTLGYGGHSSLLLEKKPNIKIIGIDQDQSAIDFSTKRLHPFGERAVIKKGRFSKIIAEIIQEYGVEQIKGILADIGVSSLQLDQKTRGFSFQSDTLDMRMDNNALLSAADVVNGYSLLELERVLKEYAEMRNYKKVASFIVQHRPFVSAQELSEKTKHLLGSSKKIHPATLLMQAIRIEVNDELGELRSLLDVIENAALKKTKVAIISFHSLEDRIVKQRFSRWSKACICPPEAMRCVCGANNALGRVITKKPITAQADELKANPRSRSAKLRVFEIDHE
jgi:16S rRNA (cytosine1402-N4)-methyltransferase